MGSEVVLEMRRVNLVNYFKCLLVYLPFLFSLNCNAQVIPQIPDATFKAVQEAIIADSKPTSEVIRVGIGTNNFGTYQYDEIVVFGTGDTQIFDNKMLIGNFRANQNIRIVLKDGLFNIYTPESNLPEKVVGPVQITSNYGLLGIKDLKRAGKQALYHGAFELVKNSDSTFNLVNMVEVEEYLKGVVPNEMPVRFGLEALKAQTVAARNYVLSPRVKASPNYDVVDSVASQVYFGANTEQDLATQAVKETEGIVALYDWDLILAQYSSTAGGYTESFANAFSDPKSKEFPSEDKPYLKAKPDIIGQEPLNSEESASLYYKSAPDSYDVRSPYFRWEREWSLEELKSVLELTLPAQSATGFVKPVFKKGDVLGNIKEIKVNKRGDSGKIIEMEIITDLQNYKVFKELVIRRLFVKDGKALPSANVVFENVADENLTSIKAFGGGYGHGVGMSQYGAGFMGSELNKTYDEILQHYYSGVTLATKPFIISSDASQAVYNQSFYAPKKYAKVIVDNKFGVDKIKIDINGREKIFELPKELFGYKRYCEIDISKYIEKGRNTLSFTFPEYNENKGLRLYVELVEKDDEKYSW